MHGHGGNIQALHVQKQLINVNKGFIHLLIYHFMLSTNHYLF